MINQNVDVDNVISSHSGNSRLSHHSSFLHAKYNGLNIKPNRNPSRVSFHVHGHFMSEPTPPAEFRPPS